MAHEFRRSVLAAILALCLGALTAGASEEELRNIEEWQEQNQWEEEWEEEKSRNADDDGHKRNSNRHRDGRPELLRVPGGSADERARDAMDETRDRRPAPWVDTGPEENVDGQLDAIDHFMGDQPAVVADEEEVEEYFPEDEVGYEEEPVSFASNDMDGYEYCGLGCGGAQSVRKRGANPINYHITCHGSTNRCEKNCDECSCAVFKSSKGGNEREYVRDGNAGGQGLITLDSAAEANGHDWYCYCVKD
jgi:hypothetical protein